MTASADVRNCPTASDAAPPAHPGDLIPGFRLTPHRRRVLAEIHAGEVRAEGGRFLNRDRSRVTKTVEAFERAGWVTFAPLDPDMPRLTAAGVFHLNSPASTEVHDVETKPDGYGSYCWRCSCGRGSASPHSERAANHNAAMHRNRMASIR